ncbi:MAG TPA: Fic family protein [Saprospiraceae bacterium]|nr:Fic family protein [Saprospiraceae bacterium]HMQ83278.1 Fic family protein [Saprospiraceae bacterium]
MSLLFNLILQELKNTYIQSIDFDPVHVLTKKNQEQLPVDYFQFYHAVSSVYSSKLEGEAIDFDSYYKYKFLKVNYQADYTKRSDDLYRAYEFIQHNTLNFENTCKAHAHLTAHLLPATQRGKLRNMPMFVINEADRIEYVACDPYRVKTEILSLFAAIETLKQQPLSIFEQFFFAALIHLVFVKIHPFQDGNGRTARLLEKWFLLESMGKEATAIELEKSYFLNRTAYYHNIRAIGLEYDTLDYAKALPFLMMTIQSLNTPTPST